MPKIGCANDKAHGNLLMVLPDVGLCRDCKEFYRIEGKKQTPVPEAERPQIITALRDKVGKTGEKVDEIADLFGIAREVDDTDGGGLWPLDE